jgi:hypothetical protein
LQSALSNSAITWSYCVIGVTLRTCGYATHRCLLSTDAAFPQA